MLHKVRFLLEKLKQIRNKFSLHPSWPQSLDARVPGYNVQMWITFVKKHTVWVAIAPFFLNFEGIGYQLTRIHPKKHENHKKHRIGRETGGFDWKMLMSQKCNFSEGSRLSGESRAGPSLSGGALPRRGHMGPYGFFWAPSIPAQVRVCLVPKSRLTNIYDL